MNWVDLVIGGSILACLAAAYWQIEKSIKLDIVAMEQMAAKADDLCKECHQGDEKP